MTPAEAERVEALLRLLNPDAELVRAVHGVVPLHHVLDTGRFDRARASRSPGWARALAGEALPESAEYGVCSFVFRADRPFHPGRLHALLEEGWSGVLRSKGFLWLASRPDRVGVWSHAGPSASLEPGGRWGTPDEDDGGWGAPRQELVFIGVDMDQATLLARLGACLLDAAEMAEGEPRWRRQPDPFGPWDDDADDPADGGLVRG